MKSLISTTHRKSLPPERLTPDQRARGQDIATRTLILLRNLLMLEVVTKL
jgi:hypothetical protein